jgi:hypothetical protein
MSLELENQQLRNKVDQLGLQLTEATGKITELTGQLTEATGKITELTGKLEAAQKLIAELQEQKKPPPPFVKANIKKEPDQPKKERKKRPSSQNGVRRLEIEPTETLEKKPDKCPTCQNQLGGVSLSRKRQVIELPQPSPLRVTEYEIYKGWCSNCQKWHEAELDLSGQVMGQGRIGNGIASLVGYLREVLRLPVRLIQHYLRELHQLEISTGEIMELLHRLAEELKPECERLKKTCQESPIKYVDETTWREDGQNGYVWSLTSTDEEEPVRYYEYHQSREGQIARKLVGNRPEGATVSDFYAGYNNVGGIQQRCWSHLLRDLHKLKEDHPKNEEVWAWAEAVKALYEKGQELVKREKPPPTEEERQKLYTELQEEAKRLGLCYAQQKEHPCNTLAKRLLRHLDELFPFVRIPGLKADNNTAERSVRPIAVARKISGGTRSTKGSQTRMILRSLFGTWQLRGLNPLQKCRELLCPRPPVLQTSH